MKKQDLYSELSSIRNLMERSTKFISLSGLSGIMAGIYALIGSFIGYKLVYPVSGGLLYRDNIVNDVSVLQHLLFVAAGVLVFSVVTGVWLTIKQAGKKGESFWNPISKRLLINFAIPLFTGGLFILIMIFKGNYGVVSSASLVFYGLALVASSQYTFSDVKWLGALEIMLGLLAALFPGYGIVFWSIGFGLLHILYGTIMHFKYKQ